MEEVRQSDFLRSADFSSDEVVVNKIGDIVILLPKQNKWESFMRAIDMFSDDFMEDGRTTDIVQEREAL